MKLLREPMLAALLVSMLLPAANASAQSIEDNIRPVGQVCLQGQACVGTLVGEAPSSSVSSAAASEPEPVATAPEPEPESEPAVEQVAASAAAPATDFDAAASYQMSCFACHGTGAAGAPMPGDAEAWSARTEKGMDAVMANVFNGLNAMPARGLCMDCSDDNLRALVDYMLAQ